MDLQKLITFGANAQSLCVDLLGIYKNSRSKSLKLKNELLRDNVISDMTTHEKFVANSDLMKVKAFT